MKDKVFEKFLKDNEHTNMCSPSIPVLTDLQLKRDMYNKMILPYIKKAKEEFVKSVECGNCIFLKIKIKELEDELNKLKRKINKVDTK